MNKQILLILVLAVAWTFSGVAAPGPTDPAGADRNAENGAALAPESDTASAPVDKARLQGRIKQLQATLQNVQNGLRRIDPAGAPPATETDAPPSPDAGAGTDSATDSNAGPETAANQGAEAATPVDPPNFEARSSSSRPSSKTPCGKTSAAPFSALPREPTWRATGPSFPPKPASTASAPSRLSVPGPTARRSWTRPTGRLWSGWSVSSRTSARPWPNTAPCWGS